MRDFSILQALEEEMPKRGPVTNFTKWTRLRPGVSDRFYNPRTIGQLRSARHGRTLTI